jgi:uncharacterized protein YbjT (DUF2867 family)
MRKHDGKESAVLLITGATGNVGRPLVSELLAAGASVRALTRNPEAVNLPDGVDVVAGDLADPDCVSDALNGVTAMFVNPAAVGRSAARLLELADQRGVGRLVLLSSGAIRDGDDQDGNHSDPLAAWHKGIEAAVTASGLEWTVLRSEEFAVNVIQQWAAQVRYSGAVREAYGGATNAVIDERDVAAVAAKTLLRDDDVGRIYRLTGPQSMSRTGMVAVIAAVLGRDVRFEEVPPEAALEAMVSNGLAQPIAESVLKMRAGMVGHEAFVSSAVDELTGKPARSFDKWVSDHAEAFS